MLEIFNIRYNELKNINKILENIITETVEYNSPVFEFRTDNKEDILSTLNYILFNLCFTEKLLNEDIKIVDITIDNIDTLNTIKKNKKIKFFISKYTSEETNEVIFELRNTSILKSDYYIGNPNFFIKYIPKDYKKDILKKISINITYKHE